MTAPWMRRGLIGLAVVIVLAQGTIALVHPRGDFLLHWEFGRRLRTGEFLYEGGMHLPYPPAWAVPHVPFSMVSQHLAKPASLLLGVGALLTLLWILDHLTRRGLPLGRDHLFWVTAGSLFITSRFITRDFDDGGQNLLLLTLAWLGLWLLVKRRPLAGGASMGLAVALKCTAGIFLLYFLLKRQWRMAAATLAWASLFFLTPILWQGPAQFYRHVEFWKNGVLAGLRQTNPTVGVLGPERMDNKSLRPSLARYLMSLPEGHPGRHAHPWYVDFGNVPPARAGAIIKGILLAGLLLMAWLFRRPLDEGDVLSLLCEAASVSILMLLYSPITWCQHCVATLPAVYLLTRGLAAGRIRSPWAKAALAGIALVFLGSNSRVIGDDLSLLLESHHVFTFTLVALLAVLTLCRPGRESLGGHSALPLKLDKARFGVAWSHERIIGRRFEENPSLGLLNRIRVVLGW